MYKLGREKLTDLFESHRWEVAALFRLLLAIALNSLQWKMDLRTVFSWWPRR